MHLSNHGGKCCGIKVIHGFPQGPDSIVIAIAAEKLPLGFRQNGGGGEEYTRPGQRFYYDAAPKETGERRLLRYLAHVDKRRPGHCVEVTLAKQDFNNQVGHWEATLLNYGFKFVNKFKNSNSGHMVYIYHRISGKVPKIVFKEEENVEAETGPK